MTDLAQGTSTQPIPSAWQSLLVKRDEGIAWVTLNSCKKPNALSPTLNGEMLEMLAELEVGTNVNIVVLIDAGDTLSVRIGLRL